MHYIQRMQVVEPLEDALHDGRDIFTPKGLLLLSPLLYQLAQSASSSVLHLYVNEQLALDYSQKLDYVGMLDSLEDFSLVSEALYLVPLY